jgi:tripartite-type tricarboxylate transporter receptor subunit TctC
MQRRTIVIALTAVTGLAAGGGAWAQVYPSKPVRLIVPFAPGGTTDIVARVVSEKLGPALGQTVIVENKAGGGGSVGATEIARAAPDGYTLGMATVSTTAANPAINPKLAYNPLTDFTPITNVAATPNVIAVHPSFPAKDYKAFIAELKAHPGKYSYGSSGTGGIGHLQMELFKNLSGTFVTHIPYRGAGPALQDLIGGQVDLMFDGLGSSANHIRGGRIKALAVAAAKHAPGFPDVPTAAEAGVPGYEVATWYGLWAPKGTPREIVERLQAELAKAFAGPELQGIWNGLGADTPNLYGDAFGKFVASEIKRWGEVVKNSGAKLD